VPGPLLTAILLGIVEGVTEFIPVSSTGHLRLVGAWLGRAGSREQSFEIFIQLGAIFAVAWDFRKRLVGLCAGVLHDGASRRIVAGVLLAFLPAAAAGLAFHGLIERHLLFEGPIAAALIVGGVLILVVEAIDHKGRTDSLESVSYAQALGVGFAQVAALFPGFSRSAATILGGLLVGMSRPVATEFSFYLAIPTLAAASIYSLWRELPNLGAADAPYFIAGFIAAFVSAAVVVKAFLAYVRSHTFRPFAWYRIGFGLLILILLLR
jgi:undecaprenyl-diphosphatase